MQSLNYAPRHWARQVNRIMIKFLLSLGPLRLTLLLPVVILIVAAPLIGDQTVMHGWKLITTVIFPVMVPMFFFILPLDMTMCLIMMQEKPDAIKKRYRQIIWLELALMVVLLLAWLPFVIRLLSS